MSELSEQLLEYLEEKNITKKDIELPKKGDEELTLQNVKSDPAYFSDMFIIFFIEFRKNFKNFDSKEVSELIQVNEKICQELLQLKSYTLRKIDFGKGKAIRHLNTYINENYFEMNDFFDLCAEVYL